MKCLLYDWNSYFRQDIDELLRQNSITTEKFSWKFNDYEEDEAFENWFSQNIETGVYDFVISVNYFPLIAKGCYEKGYKYIAWCYDCPLNVNNPEKTMGYSTNYIFMFDKKQYEEYRDLGFDTVYHLPLGVNKGRVTGYAISELQDDKYICDVSLVGSLYESQLPVITSRVSDDVKNLLNEIVKVQENIYDRYVIKQCITDDLLRLINSFYVGTDFEVSKKALEFSLACEATRNNRLMLLNLLGRRYDTALYSFQTFDKLDRVRQCGVLDYATQLPKAIVNSKISLNPILRCTQSGIPLRAFDVMGYGGFLLTSYQSEIAATFEDGVHLAMYGSYEEALDKAEYYIKHEEIRRTIAQNAQKLVLSDFTLESRFEDILRITKI